MWFWYPLIDWCGCSWRKAGASLSSWGLPSRVHEPVNEDMCMRHKSTVHQYEMSCSILSGEPWISSNMKTCCLQLKDCFYVSLAQMSFDFSNFGHLSWYISQGIQLFGPCQPPSLWYTVASSSSDVHPKKSLETFIKLRSLQAIILIKSESRPDTISGINHMRHISWGSELTYIARLETKLFIMRHMSISKPWCLPAYIRKCLAVLWCLDILRLHRLFNTSRSLSALSYWHKCRDNLCDSAAQMQLPSDSTCVD